MNSKMMFAAVGLLLTVTANAKGRPQQQQEEEQGQKYALNIDWNDKRTLEDGVTMMCDDTYITELKITIPGKPFKNFRMSVDADVTDEKLNVGCSFKKVEEGPNSTTYLIDVDDGCDIRVDKVRQNLHETPQSANFSISDAC